MARLRDFFDVVAHKRAFLSTRKSNQAFVANVGLLRALLHDTGKAINVLFFGDDFATNVHRRTAGHHLFRTQSDLWEGLCDWECARLTKPTKPLNARDTWVKFYSELDCGPLLDQANL